jgi:formylglycine-generating enzyme required for sulfatase activity
MARRLAVACIVMAIWGCGNRSPVESAASQSVVSVRESSMPVFDKLEPTDARTAVLATDAESAERDPPSEPEADDPFAGTEAGQTRDDNGLKLLLVWCPPGEFRMGNAVERDEQGAAGRRQVPVTLRQGFWLGKFELTQGQWKQVMDTEPWKGREHIREGADYPATFVSWEEAMDFCRKLTEHEHQAGHLPDGWQITLPTEAQWEYACRAGTTSLYGFGDDPRDLAEYAWFEQDPDKEGSYPHQVGLKRENAWGLCDMHGNVWELCRDTYEEILPGGRDPEITAAGAFRVIRGGSWKSAARQCRSVDRLWNVPRFRYNYVGFRVAWSRSSHK